MTTNTADTPTLAVVAFAGADAAQFLNGQLTADATTLPPQRWRRAAYCSRQGRMIACGVLAHAPAGDVPRFLFVVAGDVAESVSTMLKRFVLRAKVEISLPPLKVGAVLGDGDNGDTLAPALAEGEVGSDGDVLVIDEGGGRQLLIGDGGDVAATSDDWRTGEILRGVPWIGSATSDAVLPQFANFDLIGGVNFEKGCFVGQEVIARLHHLGDVKRRGMIVRGGGSGAAAGDAILTADEKPAGEVINSAATGDGFVAFAAVAKSAGDSGLTVNGAALALQPPPYPLTEHEKFKRK